MSEAELAERLERLEQDNRRLKRGGVALLAVLAALTTVYATRPVPDVIKAHAFEVVDSFGIVRVMMTVLPSDKSGMVVYGTRGHTPRAWVGTEPSGMSDVGLNDAHGNTHLLIGLTPEGDPTIGLSDPQGYEMDIGSTHTVMPTTGESRKTSADSIIMIGNDKAHHVIWKAP